MAKSLFVLLSTSSLLLVMDGLPFALPCHAFAPSPNINLRSKQLSALHSTASNKKKNNKKQNTNNKPFTLNDLRQEIQKNPAAFVVAQENKKSKRYRRSRKRAENPQQQYVYAKHRTNAEGETTEVVVVPEAVPVTLAKEYGLTNPAAQHCDALVDDVEPQILGQVRVGEDEKKSASYAYIINKPAGWSILGAAASTPKNTNLQKSPSSAANPKKGQQITRLEITDQDGSKDVLEYSEADLLAVMTPEEIQDYKAEMTLLLQQEEGSSPARVTTKRVKVRVDEEEEEEEDEDELLSLEELEREEMELLSELTPQELEIYLQEGGELPDNFVPMKGASTWDEEEEGLMENRLEDEEEEEMTQEATLPLTNPQDSRSMDPQTKQVLSKIEARSKSGSGQASFSPFSRPSVVAWLKEYMAQQGSPMKGGKYWTALAGATDVDDSGIVIICPKEHVDKVFVDYLEYVAVVGNNNCLASKQKGVTPIPKKELQLDILSTLRRNRGQDTIQTVQVMVPEKFSSCSSIIAACQTQFQDGIRGDPAGNPLGRLANRRLLHCNAVSVSSLVVDESVEVETEGLPDDIAILADRRNQHQFKQGSFLGRAALKNNPLTTAYREINGAADGFPGWTVDRYDKWLLVQHDESMPRGPLPSIHDGYTAGVYYLPANPDRSAMGSGRDNALARPRLLEGQSAPDIINILENGITYQVSLDKDLSTGIFLDQRPQRAWLARNCNEETHVLNCFAHCGGFSIAAATAGASTTSLDLNKKWLDRVEPQLVGNGVDFDVRHDCIYGDCFEWLAKLAKRGEKYDIVVLDPPSASVGGKKKKRWSIKNDMPELVALAARVVKKGGILWTTTNSASLSPVKFARLCRRGLEEAGYGSAKLEKVQPMPHDFPSIGPQPVKNYVWRLP